VGAPSRIDVDQDRPTLARGIVSWALTAAFCTSFFAYQPAEVSASILELSLCPLAAAAVLVWTRAVGRGEFLAGITPMELPRLVAVPIVPIVVSARSGDTYGLLYGLVVICCVILARVLWKEMALAEVYAAAVRSAWFWVGALCFTGSEPILSSLQTGVRLDISGFHPNTIGFTLAGFAPFLLLTITRRAPIRSLISAVTFVVAVSMIVLASSRGSIVAAFVGLTVAGALSLAWSCKGRATRTYLLIMCGTVLILVVLAGIGAGTLYNAVDWTKDVLAWDDPYRGMDTGVSGRFEIWGTAVGLLRNGAWLTGQGYRTGMKLVGAEIDNGFLTVWFEMGIFGLMVVGMRYARVWMSAIRCFWGASRFNAEAICLVCFMTIFLVNNVFARYLFGIGNPISVLAILLYAGPAEILTQRVRTSDIQPVLTPALRAV